LSSSTANPLQVLQRPTDCRRINTSPSLSWVHAGESYLEERVASVFVLLYQRRENVHFCPSQPF
jgi:hypothetical protein